MLRDEDLTARMEPFDSFWEGPEDIEKGYEKFYSFYRHNYLPHMPADRQARTLVISCGPGYFVNTLVREGYEQVLGIDSMEEKVAHAIARGLNCRQARVLAFLEQEEDESWDVIFCEQELNHLTKAEILEFLGLVRRKLRPGGRIIAHGLNGANPITGAESLAQNFDHYNTFTEYSLRQALEHVGFRDVRIYPLTLYVFWRNPLNYVLMALSAIYTAFFRASFILYGKSNRLFTKKIGAVAYK